MEISLSPLVTDQGRLVMSIVRDITERRRAEETIQASLREKEALLREIHHRVKNNLQVTSSLLRLQAATIDDARANEMFKDAQQRIHSMALVHEKLYQSTNLSRIDFGDYIRSLSTLLFRSSAIEPANIALDVRGNEVFLAIDTAVPCGLIVNEILSNSLKHAFPAGRRGRIEVELRERPERLIDLTIRDDGIGLPAALDIENSGTLGLQLVRALVQQIDGDMTIDPSGPGAAFIISFPAERGR